MDRSYKLVLQLIEEETARIRRRTYRELFDSKAVDLKELIGL